MIVTDGKLTLHFLILVCYQVSYFLYYQISIVQIVGSRKRKLRGKLQIFESNRKLKERKLSYHTKGNLY